MKTLALLSILAVLSGCNSSGGGGSSSTSGASKKSVPYVWTSYSSAKSLKISTAFNVSEEGVITNMSEKWRQAVETKKTFFNIGATAEINDPHLNLDSLNDGILGVYRITDWPTHQLPTSALAVTQIFGMRYNEGKSDEFVDIQHADILVNYDNYAFTTGANLNDGKYDLNTVVLHEMGHFIGLQHKPLNVNSVMIPSIDEDDTKDTPTNIDIVDVADKYNINLSGSYPAAIARMRPQYLKKSSGRMVKVLLELRADGECVHKEDGAVVGRHPASLK